jgi:glucosamine kinase
MAKQIDYLIGVDGGGTGTRVVVADSAGVTLARGSAGPSGLINGAAFAWQSILTAIQDAFTSIGRPRSIPDLATIGIGLGLAGVHNKQWAANFAAANPGFASLRLETDAFTTLLGAHRGQAGIIVAIGTGSVGESLSQSGVRCEVGGWGFPCGDEAGGAWLGFNAINHLQQVVDGRVPGNAFADALLAHCGGSRDAVFNWLASANQGGYAQIAPLVVDFANQKMTPDAIRIMQSGASEVVKIALALDSTQTMPIALCGGLAQSYQQYLPAAFLNRLVPAHGDSAAGALILIQQALEHNPW